MSEFSFDTIEMYGTIKPSQLDLDLSSLTDEEFESRTRGALAEECQNFLAFSEPEQLYDFVENQILIAEHEDVGSNAQDESSN